jgi:hypothetical protein
VDCAVAEGVVVKPQQQRQQHNNSSNDNDNTSGGDGEEDTLPPYLRVLPQYRVVLCTTHGCCYTRQKLPRHLLETHYIKGRSRKQIESSNQLDQVAISSVGVVQPADGTEEIRGLPTVLGFVCHFETCNFRSTSRNWIRQHYNREHQWHVQCQGAMPWRQAHMQTLSSQSQSIRYFTVMLTDQVHVS